MPSKIEGSRNYRHSEHSENDSVEWKYVHYLVIVISVLGTLLLVVIACFLYLKCKNRAKRRNSTNHQCVRGCGCSQGRETLGNDRIMTRGLQNGAHFIPRNEIHSGQNHGYFYDIQHEDHVEINEHVRYHSGHPDFRGTHESLRTMPVQNPVYSDSLDESERGSMVDQNILECPLKNLYQVTERSFTQTVAGKLLVSIAREVGNKGDILFLDNMGISLHVPEGAVKCCEKKLIVLVLNWDLSDNPEMNKDQSLVSPVVYVGPHGLKLEKACTLKFRHCAFNPNQIRVMRSETELTNRKSWKALCGGDNSSDTCYLTPDECQLQIETFTLYTCVQSPLDGAVGKKWLQIAVFACPLRKEINHHQVRIYFLNKTNCALQWAIQNEANFGGKLICPEKVFLFDGNEFDMFTDTKYISNGWELVGDQNSEKISFIKIWHGQCPYISVCFRRSKAQIQRTSTLAIEMSLRVLTYQRTLEENGEKIFIQVFEDDKTPFTKNEIRCNHQIEIQINNYNHNMCETTKMKGNSNDMDTERLRTSSGKALSSKSSESCSSCDKTSKSDKLKFVINNKFSACSKTDHSDEVLTEGAPPRLFPHPLRQRLILLLDPPKTPYGQDWKDLAARLGMDACIPKLQTSTHPTAELLNVLENQGKSYSEVIEIFKEIDRLDCVEEMKTYFESEPTENIPSSREATENTCKYYRENNFRSEESARTGSCHADTDSWPSQFSSHENISETLSKDISYN